MKTLNDIYNALGLSPKSKQRWLRNLKNKLSIGIYGFDTEINYSVWVDHIKPLLTHGNLYAAEVLYNPPQAARPPWSGNGNSVPGNNNIYSEGERTEAKKILKDAGILKSDIEPWNHVVYAGDITREIAVLKEAILTMDRSLKDLQTIIANKPVSPKASTRERIVALINTHSRNGMGTQQELYNKMYKQYRDAHDAYFIQLVHEYNENNKPKINKLEYAERQGEYVLVRMLNIIKAW